MMKILVAVKRVLDPNIKAQVKADHSGVDLTNRKMALNPFCEIAVEEAVRLKEKGIADEVVVVTIGEQAAQEQLRSAMAMGADRAIIIQSNPPPESALVVAKLLKTVVEREQPQLIIMGKQTIDNDNNQTGQMLAALMNYPQATAVSKIDIVDSKLAATRETDDGLQTLQLSLPALVTTDLRLNTPRYLALPNIMKARKKPLETINAESLGIALVSSLKTLSVEPPAQRQPGIIVKSVDELMTKLLSVAGVM